MQEVCVCFKVAYLSYLVRGVCCRSPKIVPVFPAFRQIINHHHSYQSHFVQEPRPNGMDLIYERFLFISSRELKHFVLLFKNSNNLEALLDGNMYSSFITTKNIYI